MDLFKRILIPVQEVMKYANMDISEVDAVVLVGGSTRIPKVLLLSLRRPCREILEK